MAEEREGWGRSEENDSGIRRLLKDLGIKKYWVQHQFSIVLGIYELGKNLIPKGFGEQIIIAQKLEKQTITSKKYTSPPW